MRKKKNKLRAYFDRNARLSELGYRSYREYIASDDWKKISREKREKVPLCERCGKKASQVHHTSYSFQVLLGIDTSGLVSLCDRCHEEIEFQITSGKKHKRCLRAVNALLERTSNILIFPDISLKKAMDRGLLEIFHEKRNTKRGVRLVKFYVLHLAANVRSDTLGKLWAKLNNEQKVELEAITSK
jgi:hypothetical protein